MTDIKKTVIDSVQAIVRRRGAQRQVGEDDRLKELGLSSLNIVTLVTNLCAQLGANVLQDSSVQISKVATVKDLIDLFDRPSPA